MHIVHPKPFTRGCVHYICIEWTVIGDENLVVVQVLHGMRMHGTYACFPHK